MKPLLISPPFGRYIKTNKATRVMGTYTINKRPGVLRQAAKTVRPIKGGWVNRMGFRNPGIDRALFHQDSIISIAGLIPEDWDKLINKLPSNIMVELNLGCPNHHFAIINDQQALRYIKKFKNPIFKMGPTSKDRVEIDRLVALGATTFHLCNTLPTPKGGESGQNLKTYALKMIEDVKSKHPHLRVIAGGGIYSLDDITDYKCAGADHFSLATVWMRPWKAIKILKEYTHVI